MFYAKSYPTESIKEHTDKLLENLKILRNKYGNKITKVTDMDEERFWQLMEIICKYHDIGKIFSGFQNAIRNELKIKLIPTKFDNNEIKHEQISPMFIPYKKYNMIEDEMKLVYQAIYYHHERNVIHIDRSLLKEIIEEDIKPNLEKIEKELQIEITEPKIFYLGLVEGQARIVEGDKLYKEYCLMKGLLHRLDHCSSAHIPIEDETNNAIVTFVEEFMKNKKFKLNDLQKYSKENQDKNLIVIGSTGMGKTESALLWSKNDKTFFTLPLRISINAIYDRISEQIGYNHVGLLHSTALDYLEEKSEVENKMENEMEKIEQSKNLYQKITTCTIDQIFPFVFKYRGYEKMYSTLSYSKIIIDEIQAYSPEIVAIILKGLQMINNLGGKFMVMTATLPRIYKEKLEEMGIEFEYAEFIKDTERHKIKLLDKEINEDIEDICEKSKSKKTLVIVNTINKAIELYNQLKDLGARNINLIHSRFELDDRNEKEKRIKEFSSKKGERGIWITTQIVEASLDIDFDVLYTEMSTLDSLFQRLGRCYRSREYDGKEANVKIYTKDSSGIGYVYDEEIYNKSIELLQKYDDQILKEETKIKLVDQLYSKEILEKTKFYKNFQNAFKILENTIDYNANKKEAQNLLRDIDNMDIIPKCIYDENIYLFEEYKNEQDRDKKFNLRRQLNKLFISINKSNRRKLNDRITECRFIKNTFIIDTKYDNEIGLLLEKDEGYEIDTREF